MSAKVFYFKIYLKESQCINHDP